MQYIHIVYMTRKNQFGHRYFLSVDLINKEYSKKDFWITPPHESIEIKKSDYSRLENIYKELGFKGV